MVLGTTTLPRPTQIERMPSISCVLAKQIEVCIELYRGYQNHETETH